MHVQLLIPFELGQPTKRWNFIDYKFAPFTPFRPESIKENNDIYKEDMCLLSGKLVIISWILVSPRDGKIGPTRATRALAQPPLVGAGPELTRNNILYDIYHILYVLYIYIIFCFLFNVILAIF